MFRTPAIHFPICIVRSCAFPKAVGDGVLLPPTFPEPVRGCFVECLIDIRLGNERIVFRHIPLGRIGETGDVVGAVVFLASPAASLITGANLLVDGGWSVA